MTTFFSADQHFDHAKIIDLAGRPFKDVEEMNARLEEAWNAVVKPRDKVYIIGDFAFRNHQQWLGRLKGKKILIRGNHDRMPGRVLNQFSEVHDLLTRKIEGRQVLMCHYALRTWPGGYLETFQRYPTATLHFHGHSHGRLPEQGLACDVGVDVWDWQPVPWEVLVRRMEDVALKLEAPLLPKESVQVRVQELRERNLQFLHGNQTEV